MQNLTKQPGKIINGECVSGKVYKRKDSGAFFVKWYDPETKRQVKIYRYRGEKMFSKTTANKLLAVMQAEVEKKDGSFQLEKYTKDGWTDVIPLLDQWTEATFPNLKPATAKGYQSYLKNWIKPFFEVNPVQLHEIQLDVLTSLLKSIKLTGKGKQNVMFCLHAFLDYAWRSKRIVAVPPFPKRREYGVVQPVIKWLPEVRQMAIIDAIPEEHRPIFLFLKYHVRRPAEACALHKADYNRFDKSFTVHRSISARQIVDSTKTGEVHYIPCHGALVETVEALIEDNPESQFLFVNPRARRAGGRYTNESLNTIWKAACRAAGENIDLYSGLKHSSMSQFYNEKNLSISEIQDISDHKRTESVRRYAQTEIARKRALMETPAPAEKIRVVKS